MERPSIPLARPGRPTRETMRFLWKLSGPLLTLSTIAAIEMLAQKGLSIPNPPAILVLFVVYSAFSGGLVSGIFSAGIAWLYFAYFFSIPGHPFQYTGENLRRVIVWALTTPATALMVGILKRRNDRTFKEILQREQEFSASLTESLRRQKVLEQQLHRKNEELVEQNRNVQEANRLKGEFLANMSHELRTPLNAIIGFAELMHDGKAGLVSDIHKEYLGDILPSSRHLLQLINDVLDLSKVESAKMEFRPERVDLARLMGEVQDALRTMAEAKRISVAAEIHPGLGEVMADPGKLRQVLYNYLSNALKFTPEGGRVAVRMGPDGAGAFRLEVEDTGIGIESGDVAQLFVEFHQLDASTAKKYQGTGLGLALTRRIVEAQGGRVGVTSTPGKGSVFFAVLPRGGGAPRGGPDGR